MTDIMKGIRILEVAEHTFVPAASAVLADWGADVIKVEHAERGDAMRGLGKTGGLGQGPPCSDGEVAQIDLDELSLEAEDEGIALSPRRLALARAARSSHQGAEPQRHGESSMTLQGCS